MASTKPSIVIVHGAWQPAEGFAAFAESLRKHGFDTVVPSLPSVGGTTTPLPGLPEDVVVVRTAITKLAEEGKEIILLLHSYGGVVGSSAVENLDVASRAKEAKKGGVVKLVFMSAFVVPRGKSLLDMLGGQPLPWMSFEV